MVAVTPWDAAADWMYVTHDGIFCTVANVSAVSPDACGYRVGCLCAPC